MNLIASFTPNLPANAAIIIDAIAAAGGRPVLIGGAVRDRLLGLPLKDIDIEVYGLPIDTLVEALRPIATVYAVGKSFGILKVNCRGLEIDVSLPRRERKAGQGHRGFEVQSDPFMPFREAASRRDFTINAIGFDLLDNKLLDPWHGIEDLESGIIRHITDAFDEDPLRVLRACQFAARFEFAIAPETLEKCRSLQAELAFLSRERIWEELKKLLLKSRRPSLGIEALATTGGIVLFPELEQVYKAVDKAIWDRYNGILNNTARRCRDEQLPDDVILTLLLAALCLRFSVLLGLSRSGMLFMPDVTQDEEPVAVESVSSNNSLNRATSGNEKAVARPTGDSQLKDSLPQEVSNGATKPTGFYVTDTAAIRKFAEDFLQRSGCPLSFLKTVPPLVANVQQPFELWRQQRDAAVPDGVIRRLALQVPIRRLCLLAEAIAASDPSQVQDAPAWLLGSAARLGIADAAPRPLVLGRHLQHLGIVPGVAYKQILDAAFEAQLDGEFENEAQGIDWLTEFLGQQKN